MYVCLSPLLKLLDLAVLVVLWWCKTRRGAILAVLVVIWGVRWVLVVLWGSGGVWWSSWGRGNTSSTWLTFRNF